MIGRILWSWPLGLAVAAIAGGSAVRAAATRPATRPAFEPPRYRLSLTIRCLAREIRAGDEIPIEFHVKNEGDTAYTYLNRSYDRSGRMDEYCLVAVDGKGDPVPDPRAKRRGGPGGGLASDGKLQPGEFFTKTIALNRWALVTRPGRYEVTGIYYHHRRWGKAGEVRSRPITVVVRPRTAKEMGDYINRLADRLRALGGDAGRKQLVQKLMYTCDRRAVPILLESMYQSGTFWQVEAFTCYLPQDAKLRDSMLRVARAKGLACGMFGMLRGLGCDEKQLRPLIELSLASDNARVQAEGALAAQTYPDDKYTDRLIQIALSRNYAYNRAIFALACNRNDKAVAVLRQLLAGEDDRLRTEAESAVRSAYRHGGKSPGRPLRKDDFPDRYQRPEPPGP